MEKVWPEEALFAAGAGREAAQGCAHRAQLPEHPVRSGRASVPQHPQAMVVSVKSESGVLLCICTAVHQYSIIPPPEGSFFAELLTSPQ